MGEKSIFDKLPIISIYRERERLKRELEERKERDQESKQYIGELELKLRMTQQEYRRLERDYYKEVFGVDVHEERTGEETRIMLAYTEIFYHLDKGKIDLAENELDRLISEEETVVYEYKSKDLKRVVFPEKLVLILYPHIQDLNLKKIWIIKRFKDKEQANIRYTILKSLYDQSQESESDELPNVGDVRYVNKYFLEERIIGPDLYDLFQDLDHRIKQGNRFALRLKESLIDRDIRDTAHIQTHPYSIQHEYQEESECERKLVEVFSKFEDFDQGIEDILLNVGRKLDSTANFFFRDAGLWNSRVDYKSLSEGLKESIETPAELWKSVAHNQYKLSDVNDYLFDLVEQGVIDEQALLKLFIRNLYQSDFFTLNRKTFWRDDLIHILQMSLSGLNPDDIEMLDFERIKEKEGYFLEITGDNRERSFDNRNFEDFYRHSRLWMLSIVGMLPKENENKRNNHLVLAYASLCREYGISPSDKDLAIVKSNPNDKGVEKVFDLLRRF